MAGYSNAVNQNRQFSEPVPTPTSSKIRDGISYLEGQLADLHNIINTVGERFDTALTPEPPNTVSATQPSVRPPMSPIAERLAYVCEGLDTAKQKLARLLERAEI